MRQREKSKFGSTPSMTSAGKSFGEQAPTMRTIAKTAVAQPCFIAAPSYTALCASMTSECRAFAKAHYINRTWNWMKKAFCAKGSVAELYPTEAGPVPNPESVSYTHLTLPTSDLV